MGILLDKINEKINYIKNEFKNNKKVEHQGIKGSFNESELAGLINEVIPKKYKITKGIIENSNDEQSNETDIIIYDDEVLPSYIKNDLSFVPIEAIKYVFEVKSKINSKELKTTIKKFLKFKKMNGNSPTVLFAFSSDIKSNELNRYYKNEKDFFINPSISVLCVSEKCYYYKTEEEYFLKDFYSNKEWLKMWAESGGMDVNKAFKEAEDALSNKEMLESLDREQFALLIKASIQLNNHKLGLDNNKMNINGLLFNDIKFKIHKWIQIDSSINNYEILSLLSGVSNTLSMGNFGNYLLNNDNITTKVCAVCFEDMWGNLSCKDFNDNGINYDTNSFSFTFTSNAKSKSHKISFRFKEKD